MPRYKLLIEFDGSPFVGWQRQDNGPSVQQTLEEAAERLCGQPVRLHAAGRTDSGVHALGMVAHVDLPRAYPAGKVADALNALARPAPVAVLAAEAVTEDFHARFSCLERSYLYRILVRRAQPALERGRVWWHARPLDAEAMHAAAQTLVGHHDFSSFRASECQADSPVKTLDALDVARRGDELHVTARARSFLHHQVRNMVGTLALVGRGKWTARDVAAALAACQRSAAGPTAPPDGLYFLAARYPESVPNTAPDGEE
ncbi:tRNA pseudouridine(38-40) synthase TruA [Roseospira marina]|uniref:tRNA pseudouridine synthase A n=1 Tax=Roseospira marina TaxID=140057 RepID=A0A5M6I609_9PROT|nr:tRNA pseudouridine(38-40) synthase TruA [Roseospira marina]KAA5603265.1 tRNA pseudouridine(38-40) synthase TruA [Roseospira marina]MBB4316166.1 tRNA pseudouridine38-40 synthase [Roseospira marina]MBB5089358.1 tRNA pseudouridine38-40 synthase [Roseospira marina]